MSKKKTPKALFNNADLARQIIPTHQLKAVSSLFFHWPCLLKIIEHIYKVKFSFHTIGRLQFIHLNYSYKPSYCCLWRCSN